MGVAHYYQNRLGFKEAVCNPNKSLPQEEQTSKLEEKSSSNPQKPQPKVLPVEMVPEETLPKTQPARKGGARKKSTSETVIG